MRNEVRASRGLVRQHVGGLLLLAVLLVGSVITVRAWRVRHPGAMTVIESQTMDMNAMKPPMGVVPVASEVVRPEPFSARVTYTGSVAPLQEQVVSPRVEGYLMRFSVYNGDRVSQGQLLAVVDSPDLQSKVTEAEAGLRAAASAVPASQFEAARMASERAATEGEAKVAASEVTRASAILTAARSTVVQRQKELAGAKANAEYWSVEIAREEALLKSGAVSVQEYQSEKAQAAATEADLAAKEAALREAEANVEAAGADLQTRRSALEVAAKRAMAAKAAVSSARQSVKERVAGKEQAAAMLAATSAVNQYRLIRAPFAGVVTTRYVSPGQFVNSSTAIVGIAQIASVRLQANVSDKDIGAVRIGAPVIARFPKDPGLVIKARVTSVAPSADQSSRTSIVEAIVPNPRHRLVPGDSVTLDISTLETTSAISVPASAIVQRNGQPAVWVVREHAVRGKVSYTCPMHPEVIRDKPGKCPICFMELVPMKAAGAKTAHLVMVVPGGTDGSRVRVISGLRGGDEVIYQGNIYLREGDSVFPTRWSAAGPVEMPPPPKGEAMPGMNHGGEMAPMPGMDHQQTGPMEKM